MKTWLGASFLIVLLLLGCASHPKQADCEGRLKPINAPAPAELERP